MSLFGTSPPAIASRSLFDDEPKASVVRSGTPHSSTHTSSSLFDSPSFGDENEDPSGSSHWGMPVPRRPRSHSGLVRSLLPSSEDLPESYVDVFDVAVRGDPAGDGRVGATAVAKLFAAARLAPEQQAQVMDVIAPESGGDIALERPEFSVLLALVGLAQEGEVVSLDGVDERRRNLPIPKLAGLTSEPVLPPVSGLAAKPPQAPTAHPQSPPRTRNRPPLAVMDFPDTEDPWSAPDVTVRNKSNNSINARPSRGAGADAVNVASVNPEAQPPAPTSPLRRERTASYTMPSQSSPLSPSRQNPHTNPVGAWGYYDASHGTGGFGGGSPGQHQPVSPFGPATLPPRPAPSSSQHTRASSNPTIAATAPRAGGRPGSAFEENVLVILMPEKEGIFLFQHHNYEVACTRRNSKVIRRYSDFVWLLDCLHKRYPFRVLPLLPPKRVAVNGNHLSNDGAFIEKRRRGLARFLNTLVHHPVLGQEQLVVMFLSVPTELAVWRKQATISVQEEFTGRALPPGLDESLPPSLEELFERTRSGVTRSAELYITICNVLDRLVKRTEGVAADHARIAVSLASLVEASVDTYASDTSEVPLLNDGLAAMSKHVRTCQSLMEDESRAWDAGVLEDLKRQRDTLVSVRDMFGRRDRYDRDNIPFLERRIEANETKLAGLRTKPEGQVKPGEVERVVEAIIRDKESIVQQHNRSIFVRECMRDELLYFQASQYHVSRWNQDWAQERVKYAEMLSENWRRLMDDLEGMPLGE